MPKLTVNKGTIYQQRDILLINRTGAVGYPQVNKLKPKLHKPLLKKLTQNGTQEYKGKHKAYNYKQKKELTKRVWLVYVLVLHER